MTTAAPARTKKTTADPTPTNIGPAFAQIVAELSMDFLERRAEIEALAVTMLARQHAFLLGPPGTGKTALVEALCSRITDAKFWSILMDRQLGKEESFGPTDIALYEQTSKTGKGIWQRDIENTLVDAHVVFVDEVGKAGPASLNPYLRAFNEREFRNGKTVVKLPLISAIGASNEYLEAELAAMWDRFLVRLKVDYIAENGNFSALLQGAVTGAGPQTFTTVTLDDFQYAVDVAVPSITLPPGISDSIVQLRSDLRAEQVIPSDRRWKQSVRLLQASAYMGGRDAVDDDDLQILQHVLWDVEAEVPKVQKKVLALTSPVTRDAIRIAHELEEIAAGVHERKGKAKDERASYGGEAQFKVAELKTQYGKLLEKANREGRSTVRLEGVRDQIVATRKLIFIECLNIPVDRAELMGAKDD